MNIQDKIERQYKKWRELSEQPASTERDRKLDKAYAKLEGMFASPQEFKAYWAEKCTGHISLIKH